MSQPKRSCKRQHLPTEETQRESELRDEIDQLKAKNKRLTLLLTARNAKLHMWELFSACRTRRRLGGAIVCFTYKNYPTAYSREQLRAKSDNNPHLDEVLNTLITEGVLIHGNEQPHPFYQLSPLYVERYKPF